MQLSTILPRQLEKQAPPQTPDTSTLLLSLVMAAHLDRNQARLLGWRGVKPAGETAFTCRVENSDCVYGLAFINETEPESGLLRGTFDIHVFPAAESKLLDNFPIAAFSTALRPDYTDLIRNFENNPDILAPFISGQLYLTAPLSGDALSLSLEAYSRFRVISRDGVPAESGWVIEPGQPDANLPTFHLLWPFFATLSRTAAAIFKSVPQITFGYERTSGFLIDPTGKLEPNPDDRLYALAVKTDFYSEKPLACQPPVNSRNLSPNILKQNSNTSHEETLPTLHILTGFLGSGKTTFLKQWLEFLHGRERYTGVIQNEFGPVDLDSVLLKDDTVVEALDDGCVCCSLAESLRPGLARMLNAMPAHQFILETTGVANPANIRTELQNLSDLVQPGLTICIADAADLVQNGLPSSGVVRDQLQFSDVVILNKMDLAGEISRHEAIRNNLTGAITSINPEAIVLTAINGAIPFALLDNIVPAKKTASLLKSGIFLTHMNEGYEKAGATMSEAVSMEALQAFINENRENIARLKGIIDISGKGPCIVQYVPPNLEIIQAPELKTAGLSIIGKKLSIPTWFPCKPIEEES